MRKCREVMTTNPAYGLPNDTAAKLAQMMRGRDIGPVPIIENERSQRLVGIVTYRDLALKVVAEGRDARTTTAAEVMTRKVVTCHAEDDL